MDCTAGSYWRWQKFTITTGSSQDCSSPVGSTK